jgi:hypothetical protein
MSLKSNISSKSNSVMTAPQPVSFCFSFALEKKYV